MIGHEQVRAHNNGDCWAPTCPCCEYEADGPATPTCDNCDGDLTADETGLCGDCADGADDATLIAHAIEAATVPPGSADYRCGYERGLEHAAAIARGKAVA